MDPSKSAARLTVVSNRARPGQDMPFAAYELARAHDEMFGADGQPRAHAKELYDLHRRKPAA